MGIDAALLDKDGRSIQVVHDETNVLTGVLPDRSDKTYRFLNRIDWYGDTEFGADIPAVRAEFQRLFQEQPRAFGAELFQRIDSLLGDAENIANSRVKFMGD